MPPKAKAEHWIQCNLAPDMDPEDSTREFVRDIRRLCRYGRDTDGYAPYYQEVLEHYLDKVLPDFKKDT